MTSSARSTVASALRWRTAMVANACLALFGCSTLHAQSVEYRISFPNRVHHEAQIDVTFRGVPAGKPLEVRMSRTSPGRYALHEFAKNVYDVRVDDGDNRALPVSRPNLHQWDVAGHAGTVHLTYTLFADRADGTYSGINNRYAHLNIPATFMWARGMQDAPVTLTVELPDDSWDIATQLFPGEARGTFTAPDFWYFVDSPMHIGPLRWSSWDVEQGGIRSTIRLALHHEGSEQDVHTYATLARRVVAEQIAMWGDIPDFETGSYTFIAAYLPSVNSDGMEHRNSTVLTYSAGLAGEAGDPADRWLGPLGTLSHEFFHAWNVERLRPRSLEPFDFEAANVSSELWFAEGFTSYYEDLFLRRAALITDSEFASAISPVVDVALNMPGRRYFSAVEMSMQAPFVDAATTMDPTNRRNTFVSYYTGGSGIALGLDLTLRGDVGRTLDDYMRALWNRHGQTGIPYTMQDLQDVLGDVAGDEDFARRFFERYVRGREAMDYDSLLRQAGFAVRKARPGAPYLGAAVADAVPRGAVLTEEPFVDSPLYAAGLEMGSVIVELDGRAVESAGYFRGAVERGSVGDAVVLRFLQNGKLVTSAMKLVQDPGVHVVTFESLGLAVSPEIQAFRRSWFGSLSAVAGDR